MITGKLGFWVIIGGGRLTCHGSPVLREGSCLPVPGILNVSLVSLLPQRGLLKKIKKNPLALAGYAFIWKTEAGEML